MRTLFAIIAMIVVSAGNASADEGMWMLYNLDGRTLNKMHSLGFAMTQEELCNDEGTSLKDAVVLFGGFCSGVVVSDMGLVFTNHHCGYEAINQLSTTDDDLLKNGFVARTLADERPVNGLWVAFLEKMIDLTDSASAGIDVDSIGTEYEQAHPGTMTSVDSFYGGTVTLMSVYRKYTDVRLAFTPTETLGKFGGDTDNWMWPRHTSDFSVFRIYTAPDGSPADYSIENVPLRPKRWAKVSVDGFDEGGYCMTVGYPGSTERYMSSYGIESRMSTANAAMINVRGVKQEVWKRWMDSDRAVALKYSTKYAHSSNYWKNSVGMNRAIGRLSVVKRKAIVEKTVGSWIKSSPSRRYKYGKMLSELKADYRKIYKTYRALYFQHETFNGVEIFRNARRLQTVLLADSADIDDVKRSVHDMYKEYDARVDRDATVALVRNYMREVPRRYHPECIATLRKQWKGDVEAWTDDVFNRSIADDPSGVTIDQSDIVSDDIALELAMDIQANSMKLMSDIADAMERIEHNENLLTQAILEMNADEPHYSDANMTMRLSYGTIKDYTGTDGVHQDYQTWPAQMLEKASRQNEITDYKLEADIATLMRSGDWGRYADRKKGDLPLCFLSTNDITGGNSGSPMFNGRGELIGLAFDGNWDAMSGDITFEPSLQRCIGVDIRWVMFLMDRWGHAERLVDEIMTD